MWTFLAIAAYILFWLTCIVSYTIHYLTSTIQITSFSQVIYTLNAGAEGAQGTIGTAVAGFFSMYWPLLVIGTILFALLLVLSHSRSKLAKTGRPLFSHSKIGTVFNCSIVGALLITGSCLGANAMHGYSVLGIGEYLQNRGRKSDLFETQFVEPDSVAIEFPEKKRNLIHIVMESMETSYTSKENGGGYEENLIPNLLDAAREGVNFTAKNDDKLNGAYVADNTGWTIAGLVAQSAGIPLNAGHDTFRRSYEPGEAFMPNLITMGDILEEEGYSNYFMCGSAATYAGRASYYQQHGKYMLLDLNAARTTGFVPKDYGVWWGYEDLKLFDWAKQRLTMAAENDGPFNFTILTADTHFQDGYLCPECDDEYDTQYKNVIACSDRQIREFLDWIEKQDFYKDTTIVLTGDHLSMDGSVGKTTGTSYVRKAFTAVLNGPEYKQDRTREFTTMDLFPTIMEAMGISIEGDRLGLGTSLYSDKDTLAESMGMARLNAEIAAESDYYNDVIMSGNTILNDPDAKAPEDSSEPEKQIEDEQNAQNEQDGETLITPMAVIKPETQVNAGIYEETDQTIYLPPVQAPAQKDPVPAPEETPPQPETLPGKDPGTQPEPPVTQDPPAEPTPPADPAPAPDPVPLPDPGDGKTNASGESPDGGEAVS